MSWWSRVANVFRADRVTREIDEELASHIEEAIANGRTPADVRRAFGSSLRLREESRDVRLIAWLDALRADAIFGWRQLRKHPAASATAIVSLALAIGACTAAFRLIDALLLRPLPVAHPEQLFAVEREHLRPDGTRGTYDECEYPLFRQMRAAVGDRAELLAISAAERVDLTYGADEDTEQAHRQFVSGGMFGSFGLRPAAGRLFTEADDRTPRAHPFAVLSHDYWTRRFGQDPVVIGRTFRMGTTLYEIVGIATEGFTGTDTGTVTDVFVPTMMHPGVGRDDWSWFRTWVRLKPGAAIETVRDRMQAALVAFLTERLKGLTGLPQVGRERFLDERLLLNPAGAGVSDLQQDHREALAALGVLVALVLLIACANVANLMSAQAAARAREMALRVSIGAGRGRLLQLVLVESAWLALLATATGALFAWWATPIVAGMLNPPDNPVRLSLPVDWRVLGFGLALSVGVTGLFGLWPALRASAVTPASALKGGAAPYARRRGLRALLGMGERSALHRLPAAHGLPVMQGLIAAQVAFCVLVLFVAGLFVATFDRLTRQPNGFSADRLLTVDVIARPAQAPIVWDQVAEHLRALPGVERVALSTWPLMSGRAWNGVVTVDGARRGDVLTFFLGVSPGWTETMAIPLVAGRDLHASDTQPGAAIVNETFVKTYFRGESPIGRWFEKPETTGPSARYQIVGIVRDARYRGVREPIPPTAYVPIVSRDAAGIVQPNAQATFLVRTTAADPLPLAPILRREVTRARPELRVSTIRTQQAINDAHTVRERLLARLALFFAAVALALAGVGVYGVLDYAVLQQRREIGIRIAIGARAPDIARRVAAHVSSAVLAGVIAGLGLGLASVRSIDALFYQVKTTDPLMLALPCLAILTVALAAALRPVLRAVRIDPVRMLRSD